MMRALDVASDMPEAMNRDDDHEGAPRRPRALGREHFAFMRTLIHHVDAREAWERYLYLEGRFDVRLYKRTVRELRSELAAAARRAGRPPLARLVALEVPPLPEQPHFDAPPLDEFVRARRLDHFSYAEQLAFYEERYGKPDRKVAQHARLLNRQLAALNTLETLVAQPPGLHDALVSWFPLGLARALANAGVVTIAGLIDYLNARAATWWRGVKGVGPTKARRVQRWVLAHTPELLQGIEVEARRRERTEARDNGASLPAQRALRLEGEGAALLGRHVDVSVRDASFLDLERVVAPATAVRPLEKFIVPESLNGTLGRYRGKREHNLLAANNDYEAIGAWLNTLTSVHTRRAYRKEAERLLLWAILEKREALSSLTLEDASSYATFLADPQPNSLWCGPRARARWSPLWRPFEGPLSTRSVAHALNIVRALFQFLTDHGYLVGNAFNGVGAAAPTMARVRVTRAFTEDEWAQVEAALDQLPTTSSAAQRLRVVLELGVATGLRLSELVNAKLGDFEWVSLSAPKSEGGPVQGWMLKVLGKGARLREVPVPKAVMHHLHNYWRFRGLDPNLSQSADAQAFAIGRLRPGLEHLKRQAEDFDVSVGLQAASLYDELKTFFGRIARSLEKPDAQAGARFRQASTHWLRHTHGSHAVAAGMPLEIVQQNLGHASLSTTTIYVTSEARRRVKAVEEFWEGRTVDNERRRARGEATKQ